MVVLTIVTFITRVVNLLNISIFTDEAIYIRWAQIGLNDPAHRYISLTDGKQPLLTWLMYPFLSIFQDPLFAGRFVSVLASIGSVIGIYMVGRKLFGKRTAFISAVLYIMSPFFLLYDRLALMDGLLSMLGIWSIYLGILLIKYQRLDVALLLGITTGLGVLTKSSAYFFLYLLPLSIILFDFESEKKIQKLLKWFGLSFLSFIIAQIMYNTLRLSPWFYLIRQKNYSFIFTFWEFIQAPFAFFLSNLNGLLPMLIQYLTIPVIILIIAALIRCLTKRDNNIAYLFLWFLLPFLSLAAFGKIIYPRFFLFMSAPLLVIAANQIKCLLDMMKKRTWLIVITLMILLFYPLYQSSLILFNPMEVNIPGTDRNQLFDDWPSGSGVQDVIAYIREKAKTGKVVIGTEGTFGLFPTVFEIYLGLNKNVEIYGFWPVSQVPQILLEKAKLYPTYLVFKEKQEIPDSWPLELISKRQRGKRETFLLFYQVRPEKTGL